MGAQAAARPVYEELDGWYSRRRPIDRLDDVGVGRDGDRPEDVARARGKTVSEVLPYRPPVEEVVEAGESGR